MPALRFGLVLLLLASPLASSLTQARLLVHGFDDRHSTNKTRLIFETSTKPLYHYDHQKQGDSPKLVLRLIDARLSARVPNRMSGSRYVKSLTRKILKRSDDTEELQFSFELAPKTAVAISTLPPSGERSHRLLLDFSPVTEASRPRVAADDSSEEGDGVVVVIDAGHGGDDPGAIAHGLLEKDITLAISNYIVDELAKTDGVRGLLIRSEDATVSLSQRVRMARALRADLFASIHADAYTNPDASGVSVHVRAAPGATTSDEAAWLAARANIDTVDLPLDAAAGGVLADMQVRANRSASLEYGAAVLASLGRTTRLHSDRVGQGDFIVLSAYGIPSILIETGFITNPREAELLSESNHQRKLGKQIARALVAYIHKRPHSEAWMARHAANTAIYTVALGDTLNKIAEAFELTPSSLASYNDIRNEDDLKAGDILLIP